MTSMCVSGAVRRIEQYMRITVGTREEMEAMFAFLKRYMNK